MASTNLSPVDVSHLFQEIPQQDMKPCKSAVRAQKKREKMEWIKKRDEKWRLEQSTAPSTFDLESDESIVDVKEDGDEQKIYGRAPSPIPNPFDIRELYLVCIRCPRAGLIEHESGHGLGLRLGHDMALKHSFATTICRTCSKKYPESETYTELVTMMKSIKISPSHFSSGELYKSISPAAEILTEDDGIAYIPLESINNNLEDSCTLKSMIKIGTEYIPSHLRGGFF